MLVAAGADLKDNCDDMSVIEWAATQTDPTILKYFCEETDADIHAVGDELNIYGSPMHLACLCKHQEVLAYLCSDTFKDTEMLIMASTKVNYGGNNCTHICAMQGSVDCFLILFAFFKQRMSDQITKKFLNFRNKQGNTPLHEAYLHEKYDMVHLLRSTDLVDDTIANAKGITGAKLEQLYEIKLMEEEVAKLEQENLDIQYKQEENLRIQEEEASRA